MKVEPRMFGKPALYFGMFMSGIVVNDTVNINSWFNRLVNSFEKCQELLMPVSFNTVAYDTPFEDI